MNSSLFFSILSLFYIFLIAGFYFFRKKIKNTETHLYSILIVINIIGLVCELFSTFLFFSVSGMDFLKDLSLKMIIVYFYSWIYVFSIYIYYICKKKYSKKEKKLFIILYIVFSIIMFVLPLEKGVVAGRVQYTYGPAVNFLYGMFGVMLICWVILIVKNLKTLERKKIIPLLAFFVLGIIVAIIQFFRPELLLLASLLVFVTVIMYHTIENPDVKMIEQLNILKDQADKANNAKTEFLSSMSHEIRTPLNAINGFAQLILEEDNIDTIKEETKDIIAASDNLIEIVNGILDISKIEANKLEIVNVEYEPSKIFEELVKLTKARIGEKSLDFRVSIAEDLPDYLNGDYVRLKQIVLNLLTNAVKYTKEGFVDFSVKCIKKDNVCRLFISVKDSGIGIKPENITKLFSKFERFDKEKNMTIEGTGLGLAITKKLVDLMGGNINVSSLYGEGSIFSVVIDQKIVNKVKVKVAEAEVVEKIDYKDKKVLIVDDNLINLKVAGRLLGTYKVNTKEVSSGFDCLKLIEDGEKFDLILMDDMMPKMSGVETFQKLCEKDDFNTPVVALTANAIAGMKEKYLNLGFNDYISKPIDKKELERVLKTYLK